MKKELLFYNQIDIMKHEPINLKDTKSKLIHVENDPNAIKIRDAIAITNNFSEVLRIFGNIDFDVNSQVEFEIPGSTTKNHNFLSIAAACGNYKFFEFFLLNGIGQNSQQILHYIALGDNLAIFQLYMKQNPRINIDINSQFFSSLVKFHSVNILESILEKQDHISKNIMNNIFLESISSYNIKAFLLCFSNLTLDNIKYLYTVFGLELINDIEKFNQEEKEDKSDDYSALSIPLIDFMFQNDDLQSYIKENKRVNIFHK